MLEYALQVWNPHQRTFIASLERVQKFGLRMSRKSWDCDYDDLMAWANLPSLKTHRTIAKLCYIAKILHGAVHSPIPLPKPRQMDPRLRSFCTNKIKLSYARSNSFMFSFFQHSILLWNQLPPEIRKSPNLTVLKRRLFALFC